MSATTFKRDRVFWLISLQTGVYGIFMGGFGPALPLLRDFQGTSAAVAGLHGTALGIASIVAGYLNAPLVHKFGRYRTTWIGLLIFNVGALAFVIFPSPAQTIPAIFIAGIGVSTAINNTVTYIAFHFIDNQTRAMSQNNAVNQFFFLLGNIIVGVVATLGLPWRPALLLCIPFGLTLYLVAGRKFKPEHIPEAKGREKGALPVRYWVAWLGLLFTIAAEFGIAYWSAALIRERIGLSAGTATILVLAFPLGMFLGRWFGTHLAPSLSIDQRLKVILLLQLGGFLALWLSHNLVLSFIALLATGLGTAMQFVLATIRLLEFGHPKVDLAMGRSSWAAGIAIAGSPFLLGYLADIFGISRAFLIVPIFIAISFAIVYLVPYRKQAL